MPNYENMSNEELNIARRQLQQKRIEAAAEQDLVVSIINKRNAKDAAEQKFTNMGEDEKKEMAQLIMGAGGIKSKEEMGKL